MNLGKRLGDDYTDAIRHAVDNAANGVALEFGVASGRTLRIIAEKMPVVGFDSFEGLPEDWRDGFPKGMFACEVPDVPDAEIVAGWFEDTLPRWIKENADKLDDLGLVHIDCDLYSSTKTILEHLGPYLAKGVIVCFDEYHGYPGWEDHEYKAWEEYIDDTGADYEALGHGPEQLVIRMK